MQNKLLLRTLFGMRFGLAVLIGFSFVTTGCDALGLGGKDEKKAKKDKDEDEDDEKKKKKKKKAEEEEEEEEESSSKKKKKKKTDEEEEGSDEKAEASAKPSAAPTAAPAVAGDSTGIQECDDYLKKFEKCVPNNDNGESLKKMRDAFKQGAQYEAAKESIKKGCVDGHESLKKFCDK